MKALSACHPDKASRLANVLGWRRMDWSRMEGRGVLQAQGLPSDTAKKVLCGPNLSLPMEELGWKKPRGHPPTESQRRKRTMTPRPSVALPRGGWFGTQPPASKPLCSKQQLQLLPFPSLSPISASGPKSCPIPMRAPLPVPCAEPSSVPTLSSC